MLCHMCVVHKRTNVGMNKHNLIININNRGHHYVIFKLRFNVYNVIQLILTLVQQGSSMLGYVGTTALVCNCYNMYLSLNFTTGQNVFHKHMTLFWTHERANYKRWLRLPFSNPEYQIFWIFHTCFDQSPAVVHPYFWWLLFVKIVGC